MLCCCICELECCLFLQFWVLDRHTQGALCTLTHLFRFHFPPPQKKTSAELYSGFAALLGSTPASQGNGTTPPQQQQQQQQQAASAFDLGSLYGQQQKQQQMPQQMPQQMGGMGMMQANMGMMAPQQQQQQQQMSMMQPAFMQPQQGMPAMQAFGGMTASTSHPTAASSKGKAEKKSDAFDFVAAELAKPRK